MKKINKKSLRLRELAYMEIRSAIVEGRLKPGDPMIETELTEQLGVSRTPLREALALLEHEGLIETIPYKGTFVAGIDRQTFEEILDLRMLLETRAIELAADKIPKEELLALRKRFQNLSVEDDSVSAILTTGFELHQLIAGHSGNMTLEKLVTGYVERLDLFFLLHNVDLAVEHLKSEIDEHSQIIDALLKPDIEEAKQKMRDHLEGSRKRTASYFD